MAASAATATATATALHHAAAATSTASFQRVQTGIGRLVATADYYQAATTTTGSNNKILTTRLTQTSHQAPVRWIPLKSSSIASAGAAVCVMSNYGGGLLAGDDLQYNVTVEKGARFGLVTQGSNRIYRQQKHGGRGGRGVDNSVISRPSSTELNLSVEQDALLVVAPDPVTPFQDSHYQQEQHIRLHPAANMCVVDWFSSGRFVNGERWQQERLVNRTRVVFTDSDRPVLIDTICLDPASSLSSTKSKKQGSAAASAVANGSWGMDWSHVQWNAYASVMLYGHQVQGVVERCQRLQGELASRYTSIRQSSNGTKDESSSQTTESDAAARTKMLENLAGRVLLGVSAVPSPHGDLHVARFVATSNEDLYRVFHHCLEPVAGSFGMEFYKDRIRAQKSAVVEPVRPRAELAPLENDTNGDSSVSGTMHSTEAKVLPPVTTTTFEQPSNDASYWAAYTLADSALPVGSFAHSAGLEVASQLGMLRNKDDLSTFVRSATRSALQLSCPLVKASHSLTRQGSLKASTDEWLEVDRYMHALLVSNAPACRASLDQGRSLLRVAREWLKASHDDSDGDSQDRVLQRLQYEIDQDETVGHLACIFGVVSALLDLSEEQACRLMGFCVARDIVSASVRLNLVGPMAGVRLQADAQQAAEEGIVASQLGDSESYLATAAGCSPVVDTLQPCHDLLALRLFRT